MLLYITKSYAEKKLISKKVTEKVDAGKSVDSVVAALCPSTSELSGRHS